MGDAVEVLKSRVARRRLAALTALAVAFVLAVALVVDGGGGGHELTVIAQEARFMRSGLEVRAAGQKVGTVETAEPTRQGLARLHLRIDDKLWPLPEGTQVTFRWAGTIALTNRYVELLLPSERGRSLSEGATIAGRDVISSVEIDQIAAIFDTRGRVDLRRALKNGAAAFHEARRPLPRALDAAPPALAQARALFADLGADRESLDVLVRSADTLAHAVATSQPGTRELLSGAATTIDAVASRSKQLEATLGALPPALTTARSTLGRADGTLRQLDLALVALAPGVDEARRLSRPLVSLLRTARPVVPAARGSLASLRRATRDLDPLLDSAPALLERVTSVSDEAAGQLACIRPYTPEAAGLASNWTGFISYGDDKDHYARVTGNVVPHSLSSTPVNSATWTKLIPGQLYGFPRPPGLTAGQPWFLPECGVGPESVDPAKDPEATK